MMKKIRLRDHHIEYLVRRTMAKKEDPRIWEASNEHLKNIYGSKFSHSLIKLEKELAPDTLVEIVEGQDHVCENLGCLYVNECKSGNYQALAQKMAKIVPIFLLAYPILLSNESPGKDALIISEKKHLAELGLQSGDLCTFAELMKKYE
jgi:hypothetical protein